MPPPVQQERKQRCESQAECMKLIQMVLDGQGSAEEIEQVKQRVLNCIPCDQGYHLEKAIKEALRFRLEARPVPRNLADCIRSKIKTA